MRLGQGIDNAAERGKLRNMIIGMHCISIFRRAVPIAGH
jgi:hypothetical protein